MNLALLSLLAFFVAVVVSQYTNLNIGFLSIILAVFLGRYVKGLSIEHIAAGFPGELFLTLFAMTLLFSIAHTNGTLERLSHKIVHRLRTRTILFPLLFFFVSFALSSVGAGNIASVALIAPLAMLVADQVKLSSFLMAVMVATGANAGALSPLAMTGIIAEKQLRLIGLGGHETQIYANNLIANAFVGLLAYLVLSGIRKRPKSTVETWPSTQEKFEHVHIQTLLVVGAAIATILFFRINLTLVGLTASCVLLLLKTGTERKAFQAMPWGPIIMVCGVMTLIQILEHTGSIDLFIRVLSRLSNPENITGTIAFFAGLVSVYSSSSAVVLPAFLPIVPKVIHEIGGGDPLAVASSVIVGSHLVDVSPLSTLGALCIAAAPRQEERKALFQKMLLWGLTMTLVGAGVCFLFFGLLFSS